MARFTLIFTCDNAAFDAHPEHEVAHILRHQADLIEYGMGLGDENRSERVWDANGNTIGAWHFEVDR